MCLADLSAAVGLELRRAGPNQAGPAQAAVMSAIRADSHMSSWRNFIARGFSAPFACPIGHSTAAARRRASEVKREKRIGQQACQHLCTIRVQNLKRDDKTPCDLPPWQHGACVLQAAETRGP